MWLDSKAVNCPQKWGNFRGSPIPEWDPNLNVRDGALRRQNRVLIWIDGHIPPRVLELSLTDWMHSHRIICQN